MSKVPYALQRIALIHALDGDDTAQYATDLADIGYEVFALDTRGTPDVCLLTNINTLLRCDGILYICDGKQLEEANVLLGVAFMLNLNVIALVDKDFGQQGASLYLQAVTRVTVYETWHDALHKYYRLVRNLYDVDRRTRRNKQ